MCGASVCGCVLVRSAVSFMDRNQQIGVIVMLWALLFFLVSLVGPPAAADELAAQHLRALPPADATANVQDTCAPDPSVPLLPMSAHGAMTLALYASALKT